MLPPQMSLQMMQGLVLTPEVTEGKHWKGISADGKGFVQAAFVKRSRLPVKMFGTPGSA